MVERQDVVSFAEKANCLLLIFDNCELAFSIKFLFDRSVR